MFFSLTQNRGFRAREAKRPLEQIQKTQGAKKAIFFLFSLGVLHGFSGKSNEDEFSRKSNGGWIFLGIKRWLQKKNNNMIRLEPARIESGRGKQGLFRDSLIWRATSEMGFLMPAAPSERSGWPF